MDRRSGLFALHSAVLLFGLSGLFGKWLDTAPEMIVFGRTVVAALAIYIGLKVFAQPVRVNASKTFWGAVISGVVLALHWGTFFHAIQVSTVAIGLVGFSAFPVFVTLIEPLLTGSSLRRVDILSALLVSVGLLFVAPSFDLADTGTVGLLWAILSGALFAGLTLMNRQLIRQQAVMPLALVQQGVAALFVLPLVIVGGELPSIGDCGMLFVLGLICTALPHVLFVQSLSVLKAQLASVVAGLEPVYGIVFAALLLQEIPTVSTVVGALIVFSAVTVAIRAHAPTE